MQLSSRENTLADQRRLFNETLREKDYYPRAMYPGDCYIFDVVLGLDPRSIALGWPVTEFSYGVFIIDNDGKKMIAYSETPEGAEAVIVTRKFTQKQRKALTEWWPLLSDSAKGIR